MKDNPRSPLRLFVSAASFLMVFSGGNSWSQIVGPHLGYVFDLSQGGVRPILGIPGASRLGDPQPLGFSLAIAEISPTQNYALGITKGDGQLVLVTFGEGGQPSSTKILESVGRGASQITLSSEGKSAAVLFPESQTLRILVGLPEKEEVTGELDLRLAGLPETSALDDDGELVILSVPGNQGSRISSYSRHTGFQSLGIFGKVTALKLSTDKQVVVADRENHEVVLIRDVLGAAQQIRIATKNDGIDDPLALDFSKDQRRVFVVNAGSGTVADLDLEGGPAILTSCQCEPTTLKRLEGDSVFRLTELSEAPLLLLESNSAGDRILFVPAVPGPRALRANREREQTRTTRPPRIIRRPLLDRTQIEQ